MLPDGTRERIVVAPEGTPEREEQDIDMIIIQTGTQLTRWQVRVVWHENNRDLVNAIMDFADGDEEAVRTHREALTRAILNREHQNELARVADGRDDTESFVVEHGPENLIIFRATDAVAGLFGVPIGSTVRVVPRNGSQRVDRVPAAQLEAAAASAADLDENSSDLQDVD